MGIGPKISGGSVAGRLVIEPVDEHTITIAVSLVDYNLVSPPSCSFLSNSFKA